MIVIAVMGIMTAIAIPSYQTFMAQRRLNGAAREVMSDLMAARMKSITKNNRFRLIVVDTAQYQILDDANNNNAVDAGEAIQAKNIQTNYYDVTLSKTANPIFNPRGTATLGGTITVTNPRGSKYVIVSLNGRVRISDTP